MSKRRRRRLPGPGYTTADYKHESEWATIIVATILLLATP